MCSLSSDFKHRHKLASLLNYMNIGKIDEFSDRDYNQKVVYILSELGVDGIFGYTYNWSNTMGPYSSELGDDTFDIQPIMKMINEGEIDSQITNNDLKSIDKFNEMLNDLENIGGEDLKVNKKLDLVSSLTFLKNVSSAYPDKKEIKTIVFNSIPELRPRFKGKDLEKYWNVVEKYNLGNCVI